MNSLNLHAMRAVARQRPVSSACPSYMLDAADEIERLRAGLQNLCDAYDARSELATSDADAAATFADRARALLAGWDARWSREKSEAWRTAQKKEQG